MKKKAKSKGKARQTLYFVTKNPDKYNEVSKILEPYGIDVEWANITIKEIQSENMDEIAKNKALKAFKEMMAPVIVEHDGLILEEYGQIPGGLTQVFWDALQAEKFSRLFARDKETEAVAQSVIAYCDGRKVKLFRGEVKGKILTEPRENQQFQWDCIFCPEGYDETYSQMSANKKNEISMRRRALDQLGKYLKRKGMYEQSEGQSYERLKESLQKGNTILFVGAGISASVKLPNWEKLIEQLAKDLGYDTDVFKEYGDYLALAEYYRQEKTFENLQNRMKRKWNVKKEAIRNSELYKTIIDLNFPIIYTTNYDRCLEKAMDIWKKKYKTIVEVKDIADIEPDTVQIVKFHGDIMVKDSLVLSESQYFDRLSFDTSLDIKLRSDMLSKSILFVGYSLSDINIRLMLYKLNQLWKDSEMESRPKSYIFLMNKNPIQEKILKSIGIEPIYGKGSDKTEETVKFLKSLL